MKISFVGSRCGWSSRKASRFARTSGRSTSRAISVFFYASTRSRGLRSTSPSARRGCQSLVPTLRRDRSAARRDPLRAVVVPSSGPPSEGCFLLEASAERHPFLGAVGAAGLRWLPRRRTEQLSLHTYRFSPTGTPPPNAASDRANDPPSPCLITTRRSRQKESGLGVSALANGASVLVGTALAFMRARA
jgi:hypothetical protein